jgi:TolB protein
MKSRFRLVPTILIVASFSALSFSSHAADSQAEGLGIFSEQADIGEVAKPGAVRFNSNTGEFTITGGGDNMWFTNDAFHFVWKQMSGDFILTADIRFIGTNGNPHRKACLLARQSLSPGSAYADIAVHGVGLTSLQYRAAENDATHEIRSSVSGPTRVRLEKRGDYFSMWVAEPGEKLKLNGGYLRVPLQGDFHVGLGVCAHDKQALCEAVFSNVELRPLAPSTAKPSIENTLETVAIASTDRTVVYHARDHIEAPNWSRDGTLFYFNSAGRIYKLPVTGGTPQLLNTAPAINCNNDHGLSSNGTQLAISDQSQSDRKSRIYLVPIEGGTPRQITPLGPSYWHGWSPDGKTLAYCAQRNGEFDVYTMPAAGGEETRLTTAPGLDDGPDYSPDGNYIYFNSERTGLMQIWRMKPDGSGQEQITGTIITTGSRIPRPTANGSSFLPTRRVCKDTRPTRT